ncbi:MAG TPA: serine protease [Thermohalobaculum sp.]|nr:serine protease [Thermohalobaculum sp.]
MLRSMILTLLPLLALLSAPAAQAQQVDGLPEPQRKAIQEALVWSGDYEARIDGVLGPATESAIRRFQAREGFRATGTLLQRDIDRLLEIRNEWTERFGWEIRRFPNLGLRLGIPAALMREPEPTEHGLRFRSREDRPRSELRLYSARPMSEARFRELREELVNRDHFGQDTYDAGDADWFVFSGTSEAGVEQYTYLVNREHGVRGFSFRYLERDAAELSRLNVAMYNSLDTFPAEGQAAEPVAEEGAGRDRPRREEGALFSERELALLDGDGAEGDAPEAVRTPAGGRQSVGFLVSADGAILTTASAVDACERVVVNDRTGATIRAIDRDNNLALLGVATGGREYPYLSLRSGPLAEGERLQALVFRPGEGAAGLRGVPTEVQALTGRGGDIRRFMLGGKIRAKHRGAPLIDSSGRVAGLVIGAQEGQIDEDQVLPDERRLALRSGVLEAFLGAKGVPYETAPAAATEGNPVDQAVRLATVRLECARP